MSLKNVWIGEVFMTALVVAFIALLAYFSFFNKTNRMNHIAILCFVYFLIIYIVVSFEKHNLVNAVKDGTIPLSDIDKTYVIQSN